MGLLKKQMVFEVKGTFCHKGETRAFEKTVQAFSESNAQEKVFLLFGSKNKIKRPDIEILETLLKKEVKQ